MNCTKYYLVVGKTKILEELEILFFCWVTLFKLEKRKGWNFPYTFCTEYCNQEILIFMQYWTLMNDWFY